ncbi:MAG TPA: type II toxin-antitoxin system RelE/ParE family toxin [Thermoanaerobaculia bacterium]|nr:type II toxin-antitoxin system RelE/ParE family toxin [Thermoanaerobaculia bacterium]
MLDLLDAASFELADASDWYDGRAVGLGDRFLDEAESAFSLIEENQELGSLWLLEWIPPGVRHFPLQTFPYSIVYVLEPRLVVVAVAHASKEPRYWIDRLEELDRVS